MQRPARPPNGRDSRARLRPSLSSPRLPWGVGGPVSLRQSPREHTQRGQGSHRPRRAQDPRPSSPVARPSPPVLAPHDLVLVHDELVYIFEIKLVRHGAAAPRPAVSELPTPPQPQLPPAGNVFPPTLGRGRLPEQRKDALRRPPEGQTSLSDGARRSRWS